MTRNRADANGDPNALMVEYYTQRCGFGLIITEGTAPEHVGKAYPGIPGIYTQSQVEGWSKVTDAVHQHNSVIYIQLMHAGRISHSAVMGNQPLAPSAVKPAGKIFTGTKEEEFETPAAISLEQVAHTVGAFVQAARSAVEAGFDGVELHAANGYLLHQFLSPNSNLRDDSYGGSVPARSAFVLEVVDAVISEIGANRVGIRVSPHGSFNDISEGSIEDVQESYGYLLGELNKRGMSYLHIADQFGFDGIGFCRQHFSGTLIANSGYADKTKVETAQRIIEREEADLFSFGRLALANPDLPQRIAAGGPYNTADSATFYSRGAVGYTDYQVL
jgi:N-ethylmaleimide reductase